jgi:hypothetical protein
MTGVPSWLAEFVLGELGLSIPLALVLLYVIATKDRT